VNNTFGSDISMSAGVITLAANKTYRLMGAVPSWTSSAGRPSYGFYNQTLSSNIGSIQTGYCANDGAAYTSGGGTCEGIITTTATTNVIFAVLGNSMGTLTKLGGNPDFITANSFPWVDIQVIGGNAPTTFESGTLNYVQVTPSQVTITNGTATPFNIASLSITTVGNPVQVTCSVDFNPSAQAAWVRLQLYRDTTAIGQVLQAEPGATAGANPNIPFTITCIDTPSAGTYTYYCKVITVSYGTVAADIKFGETTGPIMYAIELASVVGPTGPAGTMSTTAFTSPVVLTATTTNPVTGTRTKDSTSSLTLGDTRRITLRLGYPGSAGGSGDYLFKLPSGISFNTAADKNPTYTGVMWSSSVGEMGPYLIPVSGSVVVASHWSGSMFVVPYSSTTYRLIVDDAPTNGGFAPMSSAYFATGVPGAISIEFNIFI